MSRAPSQTNSVRRQQSNPPAPDESKTDPLVGSALPPPSVAPVLAAFARLGAAIAAVARFPSHPVPEKLTARIGAAQADVDAALAATGGGSASDGEPYDDQWIREAFDSLDGALKARFEAIDGRLGALEAAKASSADTAADPA